MTTPAPKENLMRIKPYVGGASKAGGGVNRTVKLSSNENPLGPSPAAIEAYGRVAHQLALYPDGGATALRMAIGEAEGLDPARIVCGAGSDELIALLCKAYAGEGDEVLYSQHGFLMYAISALAAGAEPVTAPETGFRADVDALIAAANARTKLVFIANPNNPTGTLLTQDEMRRLREGLPETAILVLDSAYAEYVEAEGYDAGAALVDACDNVVMLRTFSKIHGLAALRLGWGYFPPAIADALNRARGPFNVSAPALAAGAAAIADRAYQDFCRRENTRLRGQTRSALIALGLEVLPSEGNFLLVRFGAEGDRSAAAADAYLQSRGLILRRMEGYGLAGWLRLSIGRDEDCASVIAAVADFLKG